MSFARLDEMDEFEFLGRALKKVWFAQRPAHPISRRSLRVNAFEPGSRLSDARSRRNAEFRA
jgi:hypothetical protein